MRSLLELAEKENILIEDFDFQGSFLGLYIKYPGHIPIILLDKRLPYCSPLTRCVLAEEIGHHFTMLGDSVRQRANYIDRLKVSKIEKAALKWAGKFLIPDEDLYKTLKRGQPSIYELAQNFNVTEDFIRTRLQIFKEEEYALRRGTLYQRLRTTSYLAGSLSVY